jgi:hypothetical protein
VAAPVSALFLLKGDSQQEGPKAQEVTRQGYLLSSLLILLNTNPPTMTQKLKKLIFKTPKQYNLNVLKVKARIKEHPLLSYVENLCRLKRPDKVYVIHKPLILLSIF